MAEADRRVEEFETYRALLFSVAYRMLGSAAEAEDLVQDAYVRFASADRDVVRDVKAFLVTILTRLALDRLKSAQARREEYVGQWLPEPVLTEGDDPLARAVREEKVEYALLAALEKLSAQERAVLLLADVLEHDHSEIAELLGISAASSRQLLHRARERVAADRKRFTPSREEQARLINGFLAAVRDGDVDTLRSMLAQDVTARGDGGGKVAGAGLHPILGPEKVTRLFFGLLAKAPPDFNVRVAEVNGAPAMLAFTGSTLLSVSIFAFDGDRIAEVSSVVNPDKLKVVNRQLAK
ncbi:MAG TPA: RNA polymerase sigma-70 factor [Thermoanaerobaculia bacterium]